MIKTALPKFFTQLLIVCMALNSRVYTELNVGIIVDSAYIGDTEAAWRIKIAGENLGWKVCVDERRGSQIENQKFDCVICLIPYKKKSNYSYPNYLAVFAPHTYLNNERSFNSFSEEYDGFLLTINDRDNLKECLEKKQKKFHFMTFYPTIYNVPYKKVPLNNLVFGLPAWGNRVKDSKFQNLYQLLNDSGFTKFYGVKPNPNLGTKNHLGAIPFDGASIIKNLQQHGIVLVFHSDIHNREGIPSSRIFEAAAASTVIISDENDFVKKHFGDSVFYINTTESEESIFNQIQSHIQTIYEDPENALNMAKKSHEIFSKSFSMESQLINLEKMHNEVILEW
jgi:hypothetical protein